MQRRGSKQIAGLDRIGVGRRDALQDIDRSRKVLIVQCQIAKHVPGDVRSGSGPPALLDVFRQAAQTGTVGFQILSAGAGFLLFAEQREIRLQGVDGRHRRMRRLPFGAGHVFADDGSAVIVFQRIIGVRQHEASIGSFLRGGAGVHHVEPAGKGIDDTAETLLALIVQLSALKFFGILVQAGTFKLRPQEAVGEARKLAYITPNSLLR